MSTFTKLTYHIVFSTKCRVPLIHNTFQKRLYEYIGGIIRGQNGHLIEIGGIEDHIHLLTSISPKKSISDVIREIKANASKWGNELDITRRFEWQKGYGAFTVSYSQIEFVRHYIQNNVNIIKHKHLRKNTLHFSSYTTLYLIVSIYLRPSIMADFCRRYHGSIF